MRGIGRVLAGLLVVTITSLLMVVPVSAEKVKIEFWHAMGGGTTGVIDRMVADFNYTHPDIEVAVQYKGSYRETLNATIAAARQGTPPNVIQSFEIGTRQNIDSGIFVPFQELLKPGEVDWNDFLDPVLNYYRVDEKLYSMPFNSSNPILYYNKDMFKKAGLDPDNPPTTFEGIIETSQKIVDKGIAKGGITWALHSWFYEQWLANMGQNLVNKENGREGLATEAYVNSEKSLKIIKWWKELYDKGLWTNPGIENWSQARQNFISQRTAMLITSTSSVTSVTNSGKEQGFEVGTAPIPIPAGETRNGVVIGGASLWIVKNEDPAKEQAAKEFVKWMSLPENQIRWHKATGYFPIRKSAVDVLEKEGWFKQHSNYKTAFDQLLETKSIRPTQGALIGRFMEVRTIIEKAIESILNDQGSIEEVMDKANKDINDSLQEYNRVVH
ncbi:MAG: sn-glycerol 3-phosphate transport system substrate-binding protein [Halanaerobiales bacterium]|nr:sn-glycerol 3-phosphate transport system substrate-binding protein [Halanaerobiales bacterium]